MSPGNQRGSLRPYARNASQAAYPYLWRGLVGAWAPRTGIQGQYLFDLSGFQNRGTLTNMAGSNWRGGFRGLSLEFDGSDDHVLLTNDRKLPSGATPRSFVSWVRTTGTDSLWFNYGTSSTGQNVYLGVYDLGSGQHFIVGTFGAGNNVEGTTVINDDKWRCCIATFDGTTWRVYVDGNQEGTGTPTTNTALLNTPRIGSAYDGTQFFLGALSEMLVYDRCLTPQEVRMLARGASPFSPRLEFEHQAYAPAIPAGTASSLARNQYANATPVFLAEATAALWARAWVATSGQTITYELATSLEVTSVKEDGASLTERASVALVDANAGSWYHDTSAGILYVSATSGTPFDKTLVALVAFYWSSEGKTFNNRWYEPRIRSVPRLELRIEPFFGDVAQVGGGTVAVFNHDGAFDALDELIWDHGTVTVKVGFDRPGSAESYGNYTTIGTWLVEDWENSHEEFSLKLREVKGRALKKIPLEVYDKDDYPQVDDEWLGKPIPRAYGYIYGVKPALIDPGTKTFKVAGHAIRSLDAIRLKVDDVWTASSFTTKDLANGEFTCSAWEEGLELSVDFRGRKTAGGALMTNAADVIEDLLTYIGETDIDSAQLAVARARLVLGTDRFDNEVHVQNVALYLNEASEALGYIAKICEAVGCYVFSDATGQWHINVFQPQAGDDLDAYDDSDVFAFQPVTENTDLWTQVVAAFNLRHIEDWQEVQVFDSDAIRYVHNLPSHVTWDDMVALYRQKDVTYFGQRKLEMEGAAHKFYDLTLPWRAIELLPGDQIRVTDTRKGFDEVLEVLRVSLDLSDVKMVKVRCGRLREFARHCGVIVDAADVLPTRFAAEDGYGAGALTWNASWSDTLKLWAHQNVAYVTDSNGFATTTDADSFQGSKVV